MKKLSSKMLNVLLAVAMLAIFMGIFLILGFSGDFAPFALTALPVAIFFFGLVFLYVFMAFSKTSFKLFMGLLFTMTGLLGLLMADNIVCIPFKQTWPSFVVITGLALLAVGCSTGRKHSMNYVGPAVLLIVTGLLLFLFSFKVIKMPLRQFMIFAGPVLLVVGGIVLVVMVLRRKSIIELLPDEVTEKLLKEADADEEVEE